MHLNNIIAFIEVFEVLRFMILGPWQVFVISWLKKLIAICLTRQMHFVNVFEVIEKRIAIYPCKEEFISIEHV